jgi:hypothetical protein
MPNQILTGNEKIDKYLRQNIKAHSNVEFDLFLNYVIQNGSQKDIQIVFENYFGIDHLTHHNDASIRRITAKQGYGLDILINDNDPHTRAMVAQKNYGLNILINDPSWIVRRAVAKQGYGLETLIHDKDAPVRLIARNQLHLT